MPGHETREAIRRARAKMDESDPAPVSNSLDTLQAKHAADKERMTAEYDAKRAEREAEMAALTKRLNDECEERRLESTARISEMQAKMSREAAERAQQNVALVHEKWRIKNEHFARQRARQRALQREREELDAAMRKVKHQAELRRIDGMERKAEQMMREAGVSA